MGKVVAVCISEKKGESKKNVGRAEVIAGYGLCGDAHAGNWHRQVSLLAIESIKKMRALGLNVGAGDFAENITTEGINLCSLTVGTRLLIGDRVIGEVSQIGKECHGSCAIFKKTGRCIMPREGIFLKILRGGQVRAGDKVIVLSSCGNES